MTGSTYAVVEIIGEWRILRHINGQYYLAWYDAVARQTRRVSLKRDSIKFACEIVQGLVDRAVVGDPRDSLRIQPLKTVRELLNGHRLYVEKLVSAEAELIQIDKILKSAIGDRRLASLVDSDFETLRDDWTRSGLAISTVSRRLSTLRSAVRRAVNDRRLPREHAPRIPEFRTKNDVRAANPKGAVCTPKQLAAIYDATVDPHLQVLWAALYATAARDGALFDFTGAQIDHVHNLIDLNPPGRVQSKKYRPILPIISPFLRWTDLFPNGHVILWRGKPLVSAKSGVRRAVRAGLKKRDDEVINVNPYSVRHSIGRYMRQHGVETEEISIWLGHRAPPNNSETTLIYSPYGPDYLLNAKAVAGKFFEEIASHAATPLLEPPPKVVDYFDRLRWNEKKKPRGSNVS